MAELTQRQRQVLQFILARQRRTGSVPTIREIAAHFGFSSPNAAAQHLKLIEKKGFIRLLKGRVDKLEKLLGSRNTESRSRE